MPPPCNALARKSIGRIIFCLTRARPDDVRTAAVRLNEPFFTENEFGTHCAHRNWRVSNTSARILSRDYSFTFDQPSRRKNCCQHFALYDCFLRCGGNLLHRYIFSESITSQTLPLLPSSVVTSFDTMRVYPSCHSHCAPELQNCQSRKLARRSKGFDYFFVLDVNNSNVISANWAPTKFLISTRLIHLFAMLSELSIVSTPKLLRRARGAQVIPRWFIPRSLVQLKL